jgi:hypothetical protein
VVRVNFVVEPGGVALGTLVALFIAAKGVGLVTWSWLWVLASLWVPAGIALLTVLVIGFLGLLIAE